VEKAIEEEQINKYEHARNSEIAPMDTDISEISTSGASGHHTI
jgi:hypothetical protein